MTLPDERYRALKCGEQFLLDLCNPKITPKVPTAVRDRARNILKHFPTKYDIDRIADALPYFISNKRLSELYPNLPATKAYEEKNENSN
jgi:hypothetical protein